MRRPLLPLLVLLLVPGCSEPLRPTAAAPAPGIATYLDASFGPGPGSLAFAVPSLEELWVELRELDGAFVGASFHAPGRCREGLETRGSAVVLEGSILSLGATLREGPEPCGPVAAGMHRFVWRLEAGSVSGRVVVTGRPA
jgi:hypothetical protein